MIDVAVVDDHPVARRGVEDIFRAHPDIRVACSVASLEEFVAAVPRPDVLLVDLYLTDGRVRPATIAALSQRCAVLVMSASIRRADVLSTVRAGAGGYLAKQAESDAFCAAVRIVAAGGFYLSPELADILHDDFRHRDEPRLTPREEQTLSFIAQGLTQPQVARRLGISPNTVDTHVKRIRKKLGAGNKADLVRKAADIIDLHDLPDAAR